MELFCSYKHYVFKQLNGAASWPSKQPYAANEVTWKSQAAGHPKQRPPLPRLEHQTRPKDTSSANHPCRWGSFLKRVQKMDLSHFAWLPFTVTIENVNALMPIPTLAQGRAYD